MCAVRMWGRMHGNGSRSPLADMHLPIFVGRYLAPPSLGPTKVEVLDPTVCAARGERMQQLSRRYDSRIKRIINYVRLYKEAVARAQPRRASGLRASALKELDRFARADKLIVACGIGLAVHPDGRVLL